MTTRFSYFNFRGMSRLQTFLLDIRMAGKKSSTGYLLAAAIELSPLSYTRSRYVRRYIRLAREFKTTMKRSSKWRALGEQVAKLCGNLAEETQLPLQELTGAGFARSCIAEP